MPTYIAMLRGINVSGQKKIKMADLREQLGELDVENVQTYIQSGNIILDAATDDPSKVAEMIAGKIKEKYGWDVPTMVRTAADFEWVVANNPFVKDPEKDIKRQYITFMDEVPDPEKVAVAKTIIHLPEEWELKETTIFGYSPNGFGRAKISNNFFEAKLKVKATTRNWRTVNTLLEMASSR